MRILNLLELPPNSGSVELALQEMSSRGRSTSPTPKRGGPPPKSPSSPGGSRRAKSPGTPKSSKAGGGLAAVATSAALKPAASDDDAGAPSQRPEQAGLGPWKDAADAADGELAMDALGDGALAAPKRNGWGQFAPRERPPPEDVYLRKKLEPYGSWTANVAGRKATLNLDARERGMAQTISAYGAPPGPGEPFIVLRYRQMVASVDYKLLDKGGGSDSEYDSEEDEEEEDEEDYDSDDAGSEDSVELTMANAKARSPRARSTRANRPSLSARLFLVFPPGRSALAGRLQGEGPPDLRAARLL